MAKFQVGQIDITAPVPVVFDELVGHQTERLKRFCLGTAYRQRNPFGPNLTGPPKVKRLILTEVESGDIYSYCE